MIRPAIVYGHGGGLIAMLIQAAREADAVPIIGQGETVWPLVHVEDLARLYERAVVEAPAGTVLIGAGEHLSVHAIAAAMALVVGVDDRRQVLTLAEARQTWGALADALALDQRVSSDRAKTLLNWTPSAPSLLAELAHGSYRHAIAA
ncbi:NAD-dependent epimerase [Halomicronema hongdechloris C2206]|uniref:NAD-dependent epimerase n=1 Tax=Halomicronema hongdechloris C2206 TaxID=1641165 RepID=A0A1Z3HI03_9CYAN|nr:NAD-dependent epimerase [Halomicronema hongdechloris C2206]